MGDQHQIAMSATHVQWLDDAVGAVFAPVEVLHHDRLALFQRLLQLQRQQVFARAGGQQPHRAALLAHGVANRDTPSADRLHQLLEYLRRRLRVRQGPVRD